MRLLIPLFILLMLGVAQASDAVAAYRSNTSSGLDFPKVRFWNSSGAGSWGSEIGPRQRSFSIRSSSPTAFARHQSTGSPSRQAQGAISSITWS